MARRSVRRLDELDRDIIRILQKHSRQSNTEIARQLSISEASVRRRIGRLVADDVINLTAIPNPSRLGYNAVALIGLDVPLAQIDNVAERLAMMPDVHFVSTTTGRYDIFIWAMFESPEALQNFMRTELAVIPGITQTETFINLEIKKRNLG